MPVRVGTRAEAQCEQEVASNPREQGPEDSRGGKHKVIDARCARRTTQRARQRATGCADGNAQDAADVCNIN